MAWRLPRPCCDRRTYDGTGGGHPVSRPARAIWTAARRRTAAGPPDSAGGAILHKVPSAAHRDFLGSLRIKLSRECNRHRTSAEPLLGHGSRWPRANGCIKLARSAGWSSGARNTWDRWPARPHRAEESCPAKYADPCSSDAVGDLWRGRPVWMAIRRGARNRARHSFGHQRRWLCALFWPKPPRGNPRRFVYIWGWWCGVWSTPLLRKRRLDRKLFGSPRRMLCFMRRLHHVRHGSSAATKRLALRF